MNGNLVHQKEPVGLLGKDSPKVPEPATDKAGEGAGEAGAQ